MPVPAEIAAYNARQQGADRAICDASADHLATAFPTAESKVWHGHPVWFDDGNPIVGYSMIKSGVRLLFWSGQSFDEPALTPAGKFKAAQVQYTSVDKIDATALRRWLAKAVSIQWDYKNIIKRKGLLERLR